MTSTYLRIATGLLGGIYLVSALGKVPRGARKQFLKFIRSLYPASAGHSFILTIVIAWEALLGFALITGLGAPPVWLLLSLVTLVVFTGALVFGARAPQPVSCACFGPLSRGPVGPSHVLRNVVLIASTGAVGALSAGTGWFMAGTAACTLLLAGWAAVAVSSPVAAAADLFTPPITDQIPQELLHPILHPDDRSPGLRPSEPAAVAEDSPSTSPFLLVFVSAGCGGCERVIAVLSEAIMRCRLGFCIDLSGPAELAAELEHDLRSRGFHVLDAEVSAELRAFLRVTAYPSHLLLGPSGQTLNTGIAVSDLLAAITTFDLGTVTQDVRGSLQ